VIARSKEFTVVQGEVFTPCEYISLAALMKSEQRHQFFSPTRSLSTALNIALVNLYFGNYHPPEDLGVQWSSLELFVRNKSLRRDGEELFIQLQLHSTQHNSSMVNGKGPSSVRAQNIDAGLGPLAMQLIEIAFGESLFQVADSYDLFRALKGTAVNEKDPIVQELLARRILSAQIVGQRLGWDYEEAVRQCLDFSTEVQHDKSERRDNYLTEIISTLDRCFKFFAHGYGNQVFTD